MSKIYKRNMYSFVHKTNLLFLRFFNMYFHPLPSARSQIYQLNRVQEFANRSNHIVSFYVCKCFELFYPFLGISYFLPCTQNYTRRRVGSNKLFQLYIISFHFHLAESLNDVSTPGIYILHKTLPCLGSFSLELEILQQHLLNGLYLETNKNETFGGFSNSYLPFRQIVAQMCSFHSISEA